MINESEIVKALIAQGKYQEAAKAAQEQGDLKTATSLYEQIWDFEAAATCALHDGDLARALTNALDSKNTELIDTLSEQLKKKGEKEKKEALACFVRKKHFPQAARLAEELKEFEPAVDYYQKSHLDFDAARMLIKLERDRDAGRILERVLKGLDPGVERARVDLTLGQIFARILFHEDSVRHLQSAQNEEETREPALRLLVIELAALGMRHAARDTLAKIRKKDPSVGVDLDAFLRVHRKLIKPKKSKNTSKLVGGRYQLGRLLGAGGAGRVFLATDVVSKKEVALKLLSNSQGRGGDNYARFTREAKLAKNLKHPNLIEVFDFSADLGFLVMEYMRGGSLEQKLETPMAESKVRRFCLDLLGGLELAHQRGIIHRDLKPANVFFDARGNAKIGDFGVAHLLDLGQTQTGGLIGTLAYMSPEQITGAPLTMGADLYGVGVTLFEALTGRLPFQGPDFVAQHLGEEAPLPSEVSDCKRGWDPIVSKLLAKSPAERFSSIRELKKKLQELSFGDESSPLLMPKTVLASQNRPITKTDKEEETPEKNEEKERYNFETPLGKTGHSTLSRAIDTHLNRSVIMERFSASLTAAQERRLYALARGGGPFLQRVLGYEKDSGLVVFEAPTGSPIGEMEEALSTRLATKLLLRLASALAPLHESDRFHGGIDSSTIVVDQHGHPTILVSGLRPVMKDEENLLSPQHDVEQIMNIISESVHYEEQQEDSSQMQLIEALLQNQESIDYVHQLNLPVKTGEQLHSLAQAIELVLLQQKQGVSR